MKHRNVKIVHNGHNAERETSENGEIKQQPDLPQEVEATEQDAPETSQTVEAEGAETPQEVNSEEQIAADNAQGNEGENTQNDDPGSEKPFVANTDKSYVTDVNDPDLLIGPYKPKEGEPATIKCPHCGEEMPTTIDTCVCCGHYLKEGEKKHYKPMEESKAKKIRWIIGAICIVAFIIWFVVVKLA